MTHDWYKQNGFELSSLIDEGIITRAENDVTAAYITPIVGDVQGVSQTVKEYAIGCLAFLLILQRSVFATRAGAKLKSGYNSSDASDWAKLQQDASTCHIALEELRKQPDVNATAEVTDICKIYFKSNFISL